MDPAKKNYKNRNRIQIPSEELPILETAVQNYLDCEALLSQFFQILNYCKPYCIDKTDQLGKYGTNAPPGFIGCCEEDHCFDETSEKLTSILLTQQRIAKYKIPKGKHKYCNHHKKKKGCILKDHKPIICVSHLCKGGRDHLLDNYHIKYFQWDIETVLQKILYAEFRNKCVKEFKNEIDSAIERILIVNQDPSELEHLPNIIFPTY